MSPERICKSERVKKQLREWGDYRQMTMKVCRFLRATRVYQGRQKRLIKMFAEIIGNSCIDIFEPLLSRLIKLIISTRRERIIRASVTKTNHILHPSFFIYYVVRADGKELIKIQTEKNFI